ncbi:MAG: DUF3536 domain-containing protein [Gemmataceae bacterium]
MDRYICIHGHFYQPPRENPWLDMVEVQDSAYPFHDWNERITAECYGPNAFSRILGHEGRIARLVNNYSRISFNLGPTLLAWLQDKAAEVYQGILQADQDSQARFSGHGSAMAQVYNHVIMPLANPRDKVTQVVWGIRDFVWRFGREPEGMWLAETAVDLETLEVLAAHGIQFTVLAPAQAGRIRPLAGEEAEEEAEWTDVTGAKVPTHRAYLQRLPSGRSIAVFFYNGAISQAVAFERILHNGEALARRLQEAFTADLDEPQLAHLATDGESYGHHHHHGDMALAYALRFIESTPAAKLTNYGEFLEKHPPTWEVDILENTAWSCAHGVERWRSDCGCNSGRPGWNQRWRGPLRQALDDLRDAVAPLYEAQAGALLADPWAARNDYVRVLLDRTPETQDRFLDRHARRPLDPAERVRVLQLMELQRHLMLMYTSCGWFFDEISGLETTQILAYAGRAVQLGEALFDRPLEEAFLQSLEKAPSNLAEHTSGRAVYEKYIRLAKVERHHVGAHYAVSSLFENYPQAGRLFCYAVERHDERTFEAGKVRMNVGHATLTSEVTRETWHFAYAAVHLGDHNVNGGVCTFPGEEAYRRLVRVFAEAFARVDTPQVVRLLDRHFGESTHSVASLFRDEQRKVLKQLLHQELAATLDRYARIYEQGQPLMHFLKHLNVPLPMPLRVAAEVLFNTELRWALDEDEPDFPRIKKLFAQAREWGVTLEATALSYRFTHILNVAADRWRAKPTTMEVMEALLTGVELVGELPLSADLWKPQNVFFELMRSLYPVQAAHSSAGDDAAQFWVERFLVLADRLGIDVDPVRSRPLGSLRAQ